MAGAQERNRRLLEALSKDDLEVLLGQIDRLTETAAQMLAAEKRFELNSARISGTERGTLALVGGRRERATFRSYPDAGSAHGSVKIACLAPSVALR